MKARSTRYTFVIEFLGGTYVHQARGESPEAALRGWLRVASAEELEWAGYRADLMRALLNQSAVPIEGCQNVWCMSGLAAEHLFLIHIIGSEGGSANGRSLAEEQRIGSEMRQWGHGKTR
jgi:hypothetical protein